MSALSTSAELEFGNAMAEFGLCPDQIIADGKRRRFDAEDDKRGKKSAWYVLYSEGMPAGAFGNWKTGLSEKWCSKSDTAMTPIERNVYFKRIVKARIDAEAERSALQIEAAEECVRILESALDATDDNPYCRQKGVKPYGLKEFKDKRTLLVPIRDASGDVTSIQFIGPDGIKRFKSNGRIQGCYYSFGGKPVDTVLLCEGFATGASLHQVTGYPTAIAFNAGNLALVAKALRAKLPEIRIIVCADNDRFNEAGNVGKDSALAAARAVGGMIAIPSFQSDAGQPTDFNDLHQIEGESAVMTIIERALEVETSYVTVRLKPNEPFSSWGKPEPLPETLLSVEPFDMALLPDVLQPWVKDIVERVQCPPDFVAVTVMAALGTVIGRRVGIRPKRQDDWTEFCNVWACIVGRPGVMKSPAMSAALAPLNMLSVAASFGYSEALEQYEADKQIHDMRLDAQKKGIAGKLKKNPDALVRLESFDAPEAPTLKRYIVNDATAEALLDICIENPQGICAYRDELVSLLKSLEREGQESARGFYLTGWNGNSSYTADRIGRGRNMRAEAVCLSVLGSTQPGRISEYLRAATSGGAGDDGLIQRFSLLVWPDVGGEWQNVDRWPDGEAKKAAFTLFQQLDAADPVIGWQAEVSLGHDGEPIEGEPPYLRFDDAAADTFLAWRIGFENDLRAGNLHPAMESHLSKYRKLVPSLALICHLADGGKGPVTDDAVARALAWAHYLKSHAERAYGSVTLADVAGAKALLKRIRNSDISGEFTARDIYKNHWAMLSTAEDTAKAIAILADYGWVRAIVQQTGGRSKTIYEINPEAQK